MKKRIICGSAAILLTGLTSAMFTAAAPRQRETPEMKVAADAHVAVYSLGAVGNAASDYLPTGRPSAIPVVKLPG